jgi:hypothetical protein
MLAWGRPPRQAANHGGFGNRFVRDQRGLHFHRAPVVPADFENIIHAAHDPEVPVLIFAGASPVK